MSMIRTGVFPSNISRTLAATTSGWVNSRGKSASVNSSELRTVCLIEAAFRGRIFAFDEPAAMVYGQLAAQREKEGFNTDAVDLMIAAIARTRSAAIATRNVKDFEGCGIDIVNPWTS